MVSLHVPNVYPFFPLCSQRSSGSKNMKNRYGLNVSPWMGPLCIGIGSIFPKCSPVNIVLDCEYIFPTKVTASTGYPRSLIMARSLT